MIVFFSSLSLSHFVADDKLPAPLSILVPMRRRRHDDFPLRLAGRSAAASPLFTLSRSR